jgi:hypothetical protein
MTSLRWVNTIQWGGDVTAAVGFNMVGKVDEDEDEGEDEEGV